MKCYAFVAVLFFAGYFGISAVQISNAVASNNILYVCWARPTVESLKKCEKSRTCNGSGTYAYNIKIKEATRIALTAFNKEFGKCKLDYCEKTR